MPILKLEIASIFEVPSVAWCSADFKISAHKQLVHCDPELGKLSVPLPDDLYRAVPKRQSEYLAGRICAAAALRQLGAPESVGRAGRAPAWPRGVTGSITHSGHRAAAVASASYRALGIDREVIMPVDRAREVKDLVIGTVEAGMQPTDMALETFITLLFSAKETLYKLLPPAVVHRAEFRDAQLLYITRSALHLSFDGRDVEILWRFDGPAVFTFAVTGIAVSQE